MDKRDIKETSIWGLYDIGQNYHRRVGIYSDTDRNYRFYNGDQWSGAKLGDVEPVQKNFIKPIVKYKLSVIHSNLYAINYSSLNFENQAFRKVAEKACELLNGYAARTWERDGMDMKCRDITMDAAVNDEGILYVDFDEKKLTPVNEVIKKNDIYYGNENDPDIQNQPYILIRKRLPRINAEELALSLGMSEEKCDYLIPDNETFEESGDAAKIEVDDQVTIVYKFYKENGTVHFAVASRWVDIVEDTDMGVSLYPIAHMTWEKKEGSARGEGEVRYLIPNQIEVNRTEMRRILTVKEQAYPMKVANVERISNPGDLNKVGATIKTQGVGVDDVHKIVGTIPPAQMSPDVKMLQDDLIQTTRDLAGAGDVASGDIDPEAASGRAILAVQQASQAPMTMQKEAFKQMVEDIARIWLEYLIVYAENGINMEDEYTDPMTGEEGVRLVNVPQVSLRELQATVKVDITPKGVYDKFAQEQTIENLLTQGLLSAQRVAELEVYGELLDDDSVAPKMKIKEAVERIKKSQADIARMDQQARLMEQRAYNFINSDPNGQASMMASATEQARGVPQGGGGDTVVPEEDNELELSEGELMNNPDDV